MQNACASVWNGHISRLRILDRLQECLRKFANLQDFLPYLLNRAGLRIGVMFSRDIEAYDVTLPMWRVLIELWHNGDHRLGELAAAHQHRPVHPVAAPGRHAAQELIVRRRSGIDGRALSLTLTERGELTERIVPHALRYEEYRDAAPERARRCKAERPVEDSL